MIKNKLFHAFLMCIILLSTTVSAFYTVGVGDYHTSREHITSDEFTLHEGGYMACGGEEKIIPIWIKNKQNIKQFKFQLDDIDFAELSGAGFVLNPEQEGILFIIFNPPVDLEENITFSLNIFTNNELTLELPFELSVEKCYKVNVDIKKEQDDICALELNQYVIEIENKGKSDEYFNVYMNAPDFVNFGEEFIEEINKTSEITEKSLLIGSDGKTTIKMVVNQSDDVPGVFNISVYAELDRGEDVNDYDHIMLNVHSKEDCYRPKISVRNANIGYGKYFHPIKIKNTGIKKVTYSLDMDGPEWAVLDTESLSLAPNQEKKIYLNIDVNDEVDPTDYQIKLTLNTGELEYSELFIVGLSGKNRFIESTKQFLSYYRHYIYSAVFILIIIFFLSAVVKRKSGEKELKIEEKIKPEIKVVKKKLTKKQLEERAEKLSEMKKTFSSVYVIISIALLAGIVGYALFRLFKVLKSYLLDNIGLVKSFFTGYSTYIFIGIGALVVLIILLTIFRKIKPKKTVKSKTAAKKQARKKAKSGVKVLKKIVVIIVSLVVLAGIFYSFVHFNILDKVKDFFIVYLYYIITGFVILVLFILFLIYSKQMSEFFKK